MNDEPQKVIVDPSAATAEDIAARLQKVMQQAMDGAYEAGYKRGWREAFAAATKALEPLASADVRPDASAGVKVTVSEVPAEEAMAAAMVGRRGEIPEIVFQMVGEKPGMTGVQIVAYARERGTPLHERSIRTALRRLRIAKRIINTGGRWYPSGHQPPGLQREIGKASDRLADVPAVEDE